MENQRGRVGVRKSSSSTAALSRRMLSVTSALRRYVQYMWHKVQGGDRLTRTASGAVPEPSGPPVVGP
jgi:hypothetical protein